MDLIALSGPILIPLVAAVFALAFDAWAGGPVAAWVAAAGLAAAAVVAGSQVDRPVTVVRGLLMVGGWASAVSAAVLVLSALALVAGSRRAAREPRGVPSAALVALSAGAGVAAASASDLSVLLIALETMALCGYGLVAAAGTDDSREASMKYLVQGAIAASLLVAGIGVWFVIGSGSLSYEQIAGRGVDFVRAGLGSVFALGFGLVAAAVSFKVAAFPFHSWAPDAYGASTASDAAFLASAPKVAALVAAGTVLTALQLHPLGRAFWLVPAVIAVGSIVFGNLVALKQTSYRRMLAYSGIAQVGYALVALATRAPERIALYAVVYGVAALGAFAFAEAVRERDPGWDGSTVSLAGLARRRRTLSAALAVLMLSLTGMPLTAGFWGKYAVFASAVDSGTGWLAIIGVIGSVVSFGYYGAVLRSVYFEDGGEVEPGSEPRPGPATVVVVACAAIVLGIGILPLITGLAGLYRLMGLG